MAIFKKHLTEKFTMVSNEFMRRPDISLRAKGVFVLLRGLPDNWRPSSAGLQSMACEGRDAIRAAMSELAKFGFLKLVKINGDGGIITGSEWHLYDTPEEEKAPSDWKPDSRINRLSDSQALLEDCNLKKTIIEIEKDSASLELDNSNPEDLFKTELKPLPKRDARKELDGLKTRFRLKCYKGITQDWIDLIETHGPLPIKTMLVFQMDSPDEAEDQYGLTADNLYPSNVRDAVLTFLETNQGAMK